MSNSIFPCSECLLENTIISLLLSDAPFLRIAPNRLQHFQFESVSFECGGMDGPAQLKRIKSDKDINAECGSIKKTSTGSSCTIYRAYPTDSGEYWCETKGVQRSNSVNITVTGMCVVFSKPILVVPILNVSY